MAMTARVLMQTFARAVRIRLLRACIQGMGALARFNASFLLRRMHDRAYAERKSGEQNQRRSKEACHCGHDAYMIPTGLSSSKYKDLGLPDTCIVYPRANYVRVDEGSDLMRCGAAIAGEHEL